MADKLIGLLPDLYHDIKEMVLLMEAQDEEKEELLAAVQRLFADQFVMTASEEAIARRERMLSILPDRDAETLEFRRRRIINRYTTKPPFTVRYLQEKLDFLLGKDKARAVVDTEAFLLRIVANITDAAVFKEVGHTVRTIKPANLVYQQETALLSGVGVQENIFRSDLKRTTRLSTTWKLGRSPFAERGPEVQMK
ncbi:YmfQ family protein [Paenibacillus profundus]|uniref:YmfQ family protein n=1 Tax=Paenibacillus profundus TaxID=1173085 RepID=A0ABS8YHX5_9BACL|nr:putative phage tail protein [Paenibacillus profundus]MCE5171361.1 YmfQ family protein [Paenibacillus profundus]